MKLLLKFITSFYSLFFILYISSIIIVYNFPFISSVYYPIAIIIFILFLSLSQFNTITFNIPALLLVFSIYLSIIFNNVPDFFYSKERFIAFLLMVSLLGNLLISDKLNFFRASLFIRTNNIVLFFVVASLPLYFSGIYSGRTDRADYSGLFNHSMMLGPMSAISIIYLFYLNSINKFNKLYLFYIIVFIAFLSCLKAGSRGAILSLTGGLLVYYYLIKNKIVTRFFKSISIILLLIIVTNPIWEEYTDTLMEKINASQGREDALYSRTFLWQARIDEFISSPLVGIGFASVDIDKDIGVRFDPDTGKVEPGSSWLAILSMTGIISFLLFTYIIIKYMIFLWKKASSEQPFLCLLAGLLVFFIIHMISEGYVFSAGSGLFFYFWLLLGVIDIYRNKLKRSSDNNLINDSLT